jgi:hypothetical protein
VVVEGPLAGLRGLLDPEGGFVSTVTGPRGREIDRSGFVAAMVLRSLRHEPDSPAVGEIRRQALDWLWSCRSMTIAGAFSFWPENARPAWAGTVPPDVDDTAIMLTELVRHGRIDRPAAMRAMVSAVLPRRLTPTEATVLPEWVVTGCFLTWIVSPRPMPGARGRPVDVVDCCVNANVVALLSMLDAQRLPGYDEAVETVLRGLAWAGAEGSRLRSLSPFYPAVASLAEALEHAVECGADALAPGLRDVRSLPADLLRDEGAACSSAYGHSVWDAPALGLARSIARASMA